MRIGPRDHRRQRCPARPAALNAACDRAYPDEAEGTAERRVEQVEPANTCAVDRHRAPRQESPLRKEAIAFVRQLEVPIREERPGGSEHESKEDHGCGEHADAQRVGGRPIGGRVEYPLAKRCRKVVGEVGDDGEHRKRGKDVPAARETSCDEKSRRCPVEDAGDGASDRPACRLCDSRT